MALKGALRRRLSRPKTTSIEDYYYKRELAKQKLKALKERAKARAKGKSRSRGRIRDVAESAGGFFGEMSGGIAEMAEMDDFLWGDDKPRKRRKRRSTS